MPSKMVSDRQKLARAVIDAARTHRLDVAALIADRRRSEEGEDLPSLQLDLVLGYLANVIERHIGALSAADGVDLRELADDVEFRQRRDDATLALREKMIEVRATVDALFGPGRSSSILALGAPTAQDPVVLLGQAEAMVDQLQDPDRVLPASRLAGVAVDPGQWIAEITPRLDALREALAALGVERTKAHDTLGLKLQALDAFDRHLSFTVPALEAFFGLAGRADLADKIRPARRRPDSPGDGPAEDLSGGDGVPLASGPAPESAPA